MDNLRIFNAKWSSSSAGPSLDKNNYRTEIFLAGCKKAEEGNPCDGCFNPRLWDKNDYYGDMSPRECFNHIRKYASNKYITFVGGEPVDQVDPLSELCRMLHKDGYHIIVITHYMGEELMMQANMQHRGIKKLLRNIDGLVDGEYMKQYRIWDEDKAGDGLHDVIGSGNQRIFDFKRYREGKTQEVENIAAEKLAGWYMNRNKDFVFVLNAEEKNEQAN